MVYQNDEFVAGLTGLILYLVYHDHIFFSSFTLSFRLPCFSSSNFWNYIYLTR